jgi:hypothetical protein
MRHDDTTELLLQQLLLITRFCDSFTNEDELGTSLSFIIACWETKAFKDPEEEKPVCAQAMQPQGSSAVVCGRAVSAQTPACNSQGCRNSSSNYDFSPISQQQKGAAKGRLRPQKLLSMQLHLLGTQCCASSESSSRSLSYRRIIFNGRYGQFPVTHSATILPREVGEMIQQRSKQFAQVRRQEQPSWRSFTKDFPHMQQILQMDCIPKLLLQLFTWPLHV